MHAIFGSTCFLKIWKFKASKNYDGDSFLSYPFNSRAMTQFYALALISCLFDLLEPKMGNGKGY